MSGDTEWRWADPSGQQRLVRTDELLAALASGVIAPNTPVWRSGWKDWKPALEVPELTSSALASANGIVPNIPPPPLFMVAVQHDYEDKSGPASRPAPTTEPPPPPRYVPSTPAGRPPNQKAMAAAVTPTAPVASAPPTAEAGAAGAVILAQPPTMTGLGVLPQPSIDREAVAPEKPAPRSSLLLPDDAGWESGPRKNSMQPHKPASPVDAEANTVADLAAPSTVRPSHLVPPVSHPTMHGIPTLSEPSLPPPPPLRPSAVPTALSPSRAPPRTMPPSGKPSPLVSSRPPPPLRKRPTLLLYGGAPQEKPAAHPANGEHPSINVPAPGAQAPKAVTQAPPWTEDSAKLDPTIPKSAPVPLPAMRAVADSIEEITGAVLLPPEEGSGVPALEEKLEELSASYIIPDAPDGTGPIDPSEALTIAGKPSPLLPAGGAEGSDSKAPAEVKSADSEAPKESVVAVPEPSPSMRIVHDLSEIWNQPEKRWMVAVGAACALVLFVGMLALVVRLFRGSPREAARDLSSPPPAPSAAVPPPAEPAPSVSAAAAAPSAESETASTSTVPCALAGAPRVVAPKAQIRIGVEALASQSRLALGFVTADKDGLAIALEPQSLASIGTAKQHAHENIRHVMPLSGKTLSVVADVEHKTDKILGARTLLGSGFVLGSADGKLVWGTHAGDTPHPLWSLEGEGALEALRAVALEGGGYAVAFRQGAAIYLGALNADKTPDGELLRVAGLGPQIGSPALGASGKTVAMAWADRASSADPWGLRLLHWKRGEPAGEARSFAIPPGGLGEQAMSPGLAGLAGGRFLLAWTEGPVASHQVRAETLGATGEMLGPALTISAEGVNAGQGQVAVLPDGRGLVVYMASPAGSTAEVVATPIACAPSPM